MRGARPDGPRTKPSPRNRTTIHPGEHIVIQTLKTLKAMWSDRRGVTAVEYAVVAAGLIAVAATAFTTLGGRLTNMINSVIVGH
jgi:Flp pilus assembly pilin Flp